MAGGRGFGCGWLGATTFGRGLAIVLVVLVIIVHVHLKLVPVIVRPLNGLVDRIVVGKDVGNQKGRRRQQDAVITLRAKR
jgi:hypothetical protein